MGLSTDPCRLNQQKYAFIGCEERFESRLVHNRFSFECVSVAGSLDPAYTD
jgi:hypothetical protein